MSVDCESGFFGAIPQNEPHIEQRKLIYSSASGWSMVWRVCVNDRYFAYKCLKKEFREVSCFESLLKNEYETMKQMDSPGICAAYDFIFDEELGNCIKMEWIDGENLDDFCKHHEVGKSLTRKIILELCDALDYLHHKQIIHRDIKPQNIMITRNGHNVKIVDFGLADTDSMRINKEPAGTKVYASPEQRAGKTADCRSDIYSLGVVIDEYFNKWYPRIASRCLRVEPEMRYQSAASIKKDIQNTHRTILITALAIAMTVIIIGALIQEKQRRTDQAFKEATELIMQLQDR